MLNGDQLARAGPAGAVPQSASVRTPEGAIDAVRRPRLQSASVVERLQLRSASIICARPCESRARRARTRFCSGASASAFPLRAPVGRAAESLHPARELSAVVRALSGPARGRSPPAVVSGVSGASTGGARSKEGSDPVRAKKGRSGTNPGSAVERGAAAERAKRGRSGTNPGCTAGAGRVDRAWSGSSFIL